MNDLDDRIGGTAVPQANGIHTNAPTVFHHTFVVAGLSCAGKTTTLTDLINFLNRANPGSAGWATKYTTKHPRKGDPGLTLVSAVNFTPENYGFVAAFGDHDYGIPYSAFAAGDKDQLFAMADPMATEKLIDEKCILPFSLVPVYLKIDLETSKKRLRERLSTEGLDDWNTIFHKRSERLTQECSEFETLMNNGRFKYVINNTGNPNDALCRFLAAVTFERTRQCTNDPTPDGYKTFHDEYIQSGLQRLFNAKFDALFTRQSTSPLRLNSSFLESALDHARVLSESERTRIANLGATIRRDHDKGSATVTVNYDQVIALGSNPNVAKLDAGRLRETVWQVYRQAFENSGVREDRELVFRLTDKDPEQGERTGTDKHLYELRLLVFPTVFGEKRGATYTLSKTEKQSGSSTPPLASALHSSPMR